MTDVSESRPHRIAVTILTGGEEAALLAAHLAAGLRNGPRRERVGIVAENPPPQFHDEPDWISGPAVVGERTSGCPCCRTRLDLVWTIRSMVERPRPVDRVIIVVEPGQDVCTVAQTLLSDPDLQRLVELDAVIATVDAVAASTRLALELPFASRPELDQLAIADRILVARSDELTDDAFGRLLRSLRSINRLGEIAAPAIAPMDLAELVDLKAWHGAPTIGPAHSCEPPVTVAGDDLPMTVTCEVEGLLDPDVLDDWFDTLITEHGPHLLRLQGAVAVVGTEHRVCSHGVRSYASSHSEAEHRPEDRSLHSLVVMVGYGLDAESLRSTFLAALIE